MRLRDIITGDAARHLEHTNSRAESAAVRGRFGRSQRLAASAERQRGALERRTGRRWERYGRLVQD